METLINPPVLTKNKTYEQFKKETLAWTQVTECKEEKQAIVVALQLPEDDEEMIRAKVFDEIGLDDLKSKIGLSILFEFLDKHLASDNLTDVLEKIEDFEYFERKKGQSINEYVALFDSKYRKICLTLPSEILAFRLLNRANITRNERLLILAGLNYDDRSSLYEQMVKLLKKFKQDREALKENGSFRLEPAYLASGGWIKPEPYRHFNRARDKDLSDSQRSEKHKGVRKKRINPLGVDGKVLTCLCCGSYRHLLDACPDSWENMEIKYGTRAHPVQSLTENDRGKTQCSKREQRLKFETKSVSGDKKGSLTIEVEAEVASLKAEIISLKEEIEEIKVWKVNMSKRQNACSKAPHKAEINLDQKREKQEKQTERDGSQREELDQRIKFESEGGFKGSEIESIYLQNKSLMTELVKDMLLLKSNNEILAQKHKNLEDVISKLLRENSINDTEKRLPDKTLVQTDDKNDIDLWVDDKLGRDEEQNKEERGKKKLIGDTEIQTIREMLQLKDMNQPRWYSEDSQIAHHLTYYIFLSTDKRLQTCQQLSKCR